MSRVADRIEAHLVVVVVAIGAVGVALPAAGRAMDGAGAIEPTLALLVATSGLAIDTSALWAVRSRWIRLSTALVVSTAVLPPLAWAVSHMTSQPAGAGVLAIGVAPSEVASVAVTGLAGGEPAAAAALLCGSTVVTVLAAGPVLALFVHVPSLHPVGLLATLGLVVALPLVGAVGLRAVLRRTATTTTVEHITDLGRLVGLGTLGVLLFEVASQVRLGSDMAAITAALLAFVAGSSALGWLLTRGLPAPARPGILLPVAMRDFAVAAGIATAAFGAGATGPLGIYGVLVLLLGAGVARGRTARCTGVP